VSVIHHKESLCFNWVAWLCKHETALPHQHLETICPPVVLLWHFNRINTTVVMSLYLMSVYSITRSQLWLRLGCWLCKHETALPHTIIWRPSVLQLCCSATPQNQYTWNVTVPGNCECIPSQGVNCVHWVLDYVSIETALPHTNSFGDHRPPVVLLWHSRINTRSNVTVPEVSVFPSQESLCFQLGCLNYVSMRLPSHNHLENHRPPVVLLWHSQNQNTRSNVTVPDVSVFHHKESIVFPIGCLIM